MGYPIREILANHTYHTMSRCHNLKNFMKSNKMKELLVEVINDALNLYNFKLISYVIIDDHFHFLIQTTSDGETISRIMQYIKSQYARKYNKIMERKGAFWNERFKSRIVELSDDPISYLNRLLWYFGYNPVKKGLVSDPREYKFGSINSYLLNDYVSEVKITLHKYYLDLGKTFKERTKKFLEYENFYLQNLSVC
jgi:REP-associated tyrosine transposase